MKTDDLISILSRSAGAAPRAVAARRLAPVMLGGALASAALSLLILGPAPNLETVGTALALKFAYAGALAACLAWLTARLARPIARLRGAVAVVAGVVLVAAVVGLLAAFDTPAGDRLPYVMGDSWLQCPWSVLALSLPTLCGTFWALRGLAPTRLRAAGLAAGLLAGAVGAFGYAFTCHETSTAFIALWYTLGIGMAGGVGALLGPRALNW